MQASQRTAARSNVPVLPEKNKGEKMGGKSIVTF
jgi:hypothetical protein